MYQYTESYRVRVRSLVKSPFAFGQSLNEDGSTTDNSRTQLHFLARKSCGREVAHFPACTLFNYPELHLAQVVSKGPLDLYGIATPNMTLPVLNVDVVRLKSHALPLYGRIIASRPVSKICQTTYNENMANEPVMLYPCPTCKEQTPHTTLGVMKTIADGSMFQTTECMICHTSSKVYLDKDGKGYQAGVDLDENSDA